MCRMGKGSENKKKERKKNETIEKAVIRFGNGGNDGGDVGDGVCTGKRFRGRRAWKSDDSECIKRSGVFSLQGV